MTQVILTAEQKNLKKVRIEAEIALVESQIGMKRAEIQSLEARVEELKWHHANVDVGAANLTMVGN